MGLFFILIFLNQNVGSIVKKRRCALHEVTAWLHKKPHSHVECRVAPAPRCPVSWHLISSFLVFYLSSFSYFCNSYRSRRLPPKRGSACAGLHSEMDLLIHPLSFSFPRNVTRFILMTWHQMTTARTWGEACTVLLYSLTEVLENPTVLLWLMNQTCPLGFLVHKRGKKAGRWDDECVCLCVFMHASMCMSFIFPTSTGI